MPPGKKSAPIIVKKRRGGHTHAHHGGSWKVAYADFVTAMMAFFLVMWIVGMDDKAKQSVQGYFSNPVGFKKGFGSGSSPVGSGNSPVAGGRNSPMPARVAEEEAMRSMRDRLEAAFGDPDLHEFGGQVEVTLTSEGLRVEFGEGLSGDATFASGSARMTDPMRSALAILAREVATVPNPVVIEGHTDAAAFGRPDGYTNWELSADRANAARRALEAFGIPGNRVAAVRGLADRQPKFGALPLDPRNRRISVLLPFRNSDAPLPPEPADAASPVATGAGERHVGTATVARTDGQP